MTATAQSSTPTVDVGVLIPVTVHFDDLDQMGLLHNSRYQVLVERAWVAFWRDQGLIRAGGLTDDAFNVVKAFTITHDLPIMAFGEYAVHLWTERMGRTSATVHYRVCSTDGETTYAHGTRTVVRVDSTTLSPTPWSDKVREIAQTIQRPHTA
jgi:acyl-CoA thioester hydrolase